MCARVCVCAETAWVMASICSGSTYTVAAADADDARAMILCPILRDWWNAPVFTGAPDGSWGGVGAGRGRVRPATIEFECRQRYRVDGRAGRYTSLSQSSIVSVFDQMERWQSARPCLQQQQQ